MSRSAMRFAIIIVGGLAIVASGAASDARGAETAAEPDYARDVKPLLTRKCYACHGALKQAGGLRLDTRGTILAGGETGPTVVPGAAAKSLLIAAVRGDGDIERMPLESEALGEQEIALLERWIASGARGPDEPLPPDPRKYWAFQPVVRPNIPQSADGATGNAIDALLAAEHKRLGLTPVPEADPRTLLRRLHFDLVGLPPTAAETEAFAAAAARSAAAKEQAYAAAVDKLLASPQYAERWGRHWMDVWRYSDWDGYRAEVRESQPHIWRWRDWIVDSLAEDKPYDRMIVEMLAGDEVAPTDPGVVRATGFLVRNWYKFNRNVWLESTVEHTGKAFLGLTINCAKCHDHFFDPISQRDYYAFRAFFEPHQVRTDRVPGTADAAKDGLVRAYDADATAKTFLFSRGDESKPDKEHPLAPQLPRLFGKQATIEPVALPLVAYYPGRLPFVAAEELKQAEQARATAQKALADAKPDAQARARRKLDVALAAYESIQARLAADEAVYGNTGKPSEAAQKKAAAAQRKLARLQADDDVADAQAEVDAAKLKVQKAAAGDKDKLQKALDAAEKKLAEARKRLATAEADEKKTDAAYTTFGPVYPAQSTGRRLALARWIASPDNPLTARVAVNHIWMRHFGEPIVPSVFDFGRNGRLPTNQPLLDWLASEFVAGGWRMKPLHRTIVMSAAYRRSSDEGPAQSKSREADPENVALWRMNTRRMEAEVVRDSLLAVAGALDASRGGPDLDPAAADTVPRRSLYFRHSKEKKVEMLDLLDRANAVECYRRSESIVPQQALAVINGGLAQTQARRVATRLSTTSGDGSFVDDEAFVAAVFACVLNRPPRAGERAACLEFLDEQARLLAKPEKLTRFVVGVKPQVEPSADPHRRARENLALVLFNHNDFITIR